jgi:L-seryl-tRNA(Ser) seleniumtransferase
MTRKLAALPAVHRLLSSSELERAAVSYGRAAVRQAARVTLDEARSRAAAGDEVPGADILVERILARVSREGAPAYPAVINATGVIIHTNLGRAPRSATPLPPYLALEYDLSTGTRGERLAPLVARLTRYFGAEAAMAVTNNAAALVLLLAAHAAGRDVVVSRGELIEIGGSFRLPEIMAAAGARLVEVGCTNRTHVEDYESAVGEGTAAILVAHRSNFHLSGFVASPPLEALVDMGHRRGIQVWVDQGSGCHLDLASYGLRPEPTVSELLAAGADAVLFSGDKLLGGPQAGIIVGSARAIGALRRHPLRRALRPDKSALIGLAATLDAYLAGRPEEIPLYRLLAASTDSLRARARRLARRLRLAGIEARPVPSRAVLGGGTTPDQTLPSWGLELGGRATLPSLLRSAVPPVVVRMEEGRTLVDLRAVLPEQDVDLVGALLRALAR